MVIAKDRVVTLSYQLFSLGEHQTPVLIEERTVDDPLEFIFGQGVLLPKVEEKIHGQGRGFHAEVNLHPRDAFGLHRPELQAWLEKDKFPKGQEVQLGMKFQTQGPDRKVISVIVKEVEDDRVLVDGNHPLAGLSVRFDLKIMRVREASEKEILTKTVEPSKLH